jgi:O-antigen ligase
VIRSISLPRPDLSDRRTQIVAGGALLGAIVLGVAVEIGTGNLILALTLLGVLASPAAFVAALRWPYVFPYGLYIVLVPFDNMLKIGGGGTLTKLLGLASIVVLLAHTFIVRRAATPPKALWLWCLFLLWNLIGVMWSPDLPTAMLYVQTLGSLILLYGVLAIAPLEEHELRTICTCIVVGGVAASLYGIYLLHNAPQMAGDFGRLMINVGERKIDPNHFANSLLAPIALAFVGLLVARRPAAIFFSLVALAILIAGVLISLSRETLLGCVVIAAVVILLSRRRLVGLAIGIPALVGIPLLVPQIGQRMSEAFTTGGAGRTAVWHVAWNAFLQRPLLGWGTSGSVDAYDVNFFTVYQPHSVGWIITPHNSALHVAVELGVVGLIIFTAVWFAMFRQLGDIPAGDRLSDVRVALTAALTALALVSFFIDLAAYKYLWLVFATVVQLRSVVRQRAPAPPPLVRTAAPPPVAIARRAPA